MFSTTIQVNFFDADPAGIMFFANAFKFAHSAYEKLLESSSLKKEYFYNENFVVPIVHSEADYLKPVYPNSTLKVEVIVSQLRESSFELSYTFMNEKGEECLKVKTIHVFVDKSTWRKTAIPAEIRDFFRIIK